jgi:hypothetical protein
VKTKSRFSSSEPTQEDTPDIWLIGPAAHLWQDGKDLVRYKARWHLRGTADGLFFRLSENRVRYPDLSKSNIGNRIVKFTADTTSRNT